MTKYREVKRKACVGERVRVFGHCAAEANGEFVVAHATKSGGINYHTRNGNEYGTPYYNGDAYVVLEPIAEPTTQPPADIRTLLADFLRLNPQASVELRKLLDEVTPQVSAQPSVKPAETIAPPKRFTRADVIAQARADVAELIRIGESDDIELPESSRFHNDYYRVEFVINRSKRTVTALIRPKTSDRFYLDGETVKAPVVGIARCAPDDVFHADIGRAIALRRALGLAVPNAYTHTPKPEKADVGAIVCGGAASEFAFYGTHKHFTLTGRKYGGFSYANSTDWIYANQIGRIIDDTDVDYAKEAE